MINGGVCVDCADRLHLVPYLPHHVPMYHGWMTRPELLAATESEPLSFEEEAENQESWLSSTDKLTFIIFSPPLSSAPSSTSPTIKDGAASKAVPWSIVEDDEAMKQDEVSWVEDANPPLLKSYLPRSRRCLIRPTSLVPSTSSASSHHGWQAIGDCNIFMMGGDEVEDVAGDAQHPRVFEVEVMIAEPEYRRRGLAELAVRMLMTYAVAVLGATHFVAKILDCNEGSIKLFQERLGFVEYKRVAVFHEVHLRRSICTSTEKEEWASDCITSSSGVCYEVDAYRGEEMGSDHHV